MAFSASIYVPGLITLSYPFTGQSITSHVRLAGSVVIDRNKLPQGTQYIIDQLPPGTDPLSVPVSAALNGKRYYLGVVSYYIDDNVYREVDYTEDEISSYQFDQDYLPTIIQGEDLSPGEHRLTIQITAFSFDNPAVEIFDIIELTFVYDQSAVSIFDYLQQITPQLYLGEVDWQIMMRAYDYVLTQRAEGALKNDVDFLEQLYDVDQVPDTLLPYLAVTLGYQYFAGIAGRNQEAVRQEIRFLPDWQKSVGTEESILVLLRALGLNANLTPLYLNLQENTLVEGVNRYFAASDEDLIRSDTFTNRVFTPFTHAHNFLPNTVVTRFFVGTVNVLTVMWNAAEEKPVVASYNPAINWIEFGGVTPPDKATFESYLDRIDVGNNRGGLTLFFNETAKFEMRVHIESDYQFVRDTRPGRNHRLSEFFDVDVLDRSNPNVLVAEDYQRVLNIILKSKPFRTKLREITFPISLADIYHVNTTSLSTTGQLGNLDIVAKNNIGNTGVNLNFPIREEVKLTQYYRAIEGFTFGWENDCDRWENRFGIFHSLAIEPDLHGCRVRHLIQTDGLMRRGYAVRVEDDSNERVPDLDRQTRLLRRLGLEIKNFKGGDERKKVNYDQLVYWTKFFLNPNQSPPCPPGSPGSPFSPFSPASPMVSPASPYSPSGSPTGSSGPIDNFRVLNTSVVELDSPSPISPTNKVVHMFRVMDADNPGVYSELRVTFDGGNSIEYEWVGCGPAQVINMTPVPQNPNICFAKTPPDFSVDFVHPTIPGIMIFLQFSAFMTPENVDYLFAVDPTYNNMPFKTMGDTSPPSDPYWYVFATVITDPYKHPVQWLGLFDSVNTNFQDVTCCTELGTVNPGGFLSIDEELEESYRYPIYHGIELLAIEDATGDIVDRLVWNGSYWETVLKRTELFWNMLPTGTGGDTWGSSPAVSPAQSPYEAPSVNNVRVIGDVGLIAGSPGASPMMSPADPCLQRSSYTIKLCAMKAGEKLLYRLKAQIADYWSLGRLHRGEYSPWDRQDLWYGAFQAGDLIDLKHNKYIDAAAMDDFYFRATPEGVSPGTAQMHPAFRYTLTPPTPIDRMQWDSGDYWDGLPEQAPMPFEAAKFWDAGSLDPRYIHISHFPNKTLWSASSVFNIALVSPETPGVAPDPVFSLTAPAQVLEGDTGVNTIVTCTVAFEGSEAPAQIDFETFPISPGATPGDDYIPVSGTLVFAPGEYLKTFEVQIIGDDFDETDELFGVRILNPVGGQTILGQDSATVTILQDGDTVTPPLLEELFLTGAKNDPVTGGTGGVGWAGSWVNDTPDFDIQATRQPGITYGNAQLYNPGDCAAEYRNVINNSSSQEWLGSRPINNIERLGLVGQPLYFSMLYEQDADNSRRIDFFNATFQSNVGKRFYIQVSDSGLDETRFEFGTGGGPGGNHFRVVNNVPRTGPHLIVGKIERTAANSTKRGEVRLAINPPNLLVESWDSVGGNNNMFNNLPTAEYEWVNMVIRTEGRPDLPFKWDAIRVGRTWEEVVPTV